MSMARHDWELPHSRPGARIYPSTTKRLAPDFDFQPQIYRADGDTVRCPMATTPSSSPAGRNPSLVSATCMLMLDTRTGFPSHALD